MSTQIEKLDLMTFPLHGVRLIEASAGTGKTYSIAALYVRLVLGHGRSEHGALMPPRILVLTFTRAATQELRDRIRKRLTEVAAAFRSGQPGDDEFIRDLLDEYPEAQRAACARRLQVAAEWMDEAAIHTIHAWCQTMLRQHAFDSGSLFDQEVDSQDNALLQQAVNDYWRRYMYRDHPLVHRLTAIAGSPKALAEKLKKLLQPDVHIRCNGQAVEGKSPETVLDELVAYHQHLADHECRAVLEAWADVGTEVRQLLETALEKGSFYADSKSAEVKTCKKTIPQLLDDLDNWRPGDTAPECVAMLRTDVLDRISKKNTPVHEWFDDLTEALDGAPDEPDAIETIWTHAADWIRERYHAEKRNRNRLDFDDLLTRLDDALAGTNGERLCRRILESFPVALIDEFQDTDPVQYRIFERVYLPEKHNTAHGLFMIGDPKQSIYAFRGADIHTYLAARGTTDATDRVTLPRNYRSTEPMVQAVNRLFEVGTGNPRGAFGFAAAEDDPVPFHPVEWKGRCERFIVAGETVNPLTFWYQSPEPGKTTLYKNAHDPLMAELTASHIVDLLNGGRAEHPVTGFLNEHGELNPVRPADIAVLVNDRYQADKVRRALRKRGADSVFLSERDSVFDQPEAVDLLTVLEAAAQPRNDQRVREALATASLCLTLEELDALNRDEQLLEAQVQLFTGLAETWRKQGVLAMIRRLLAEKEVAGRLMSLTGGGERSLTNLLHLAELLQQEAERQEGEQGLINWLQEEIAREDRSENEDQVIRLESDADLVRIITIFKSKGLEYPLVFVPFASSYKSRPKNAFIEYHDDEGRRCVELGDDDNAVARCDWEALQERVRLFYVAVTRARHACWVGTGPIDDPAISAPGYLLAGQLGQRDDQSSPAPIDLKNLLQRLSSTSPMISCDVLSEDDIGHEDLHPDSGDFTCLPALDYTGAPRENWWIASYSALRHGKRVATELDDPDNATQSNLQEMAREDLPDDNLPEPSSREPEPGTIHDFPRGAMPGNFLHLLLEWAGARGFASVLAKPDELKQELTARLSRRGWQHWTDTLSTWLHSQLDKPLPLGETSVRLADLDPARGHYKPELEFWLQASSVDARMLDELITEHTLGGRARAPFDANKLNGMLHGFIDLVFEHAGRWYVADYKSNWIGPTADFYTIERMTDTVCSRRYDMQYVLYTLALHRLLKSRLGNAYKPSQHLGGAAYLFLRGCDNPETAGVFFERANIALIEQVDRLFTGQEMTHVA